MYIKTSDLILAHIIWYAHNFFLSFYLKNSEGGSIEYIKKIFFVLLSDLFHLAQCPQGTAMLSQTEVLSYFL